MVLKHQDNEIPFLNGNLHRPSGSGGSGGGDENTELGD